MTASPMNDRYIIISNDDNSPDSDRPATAIDENEMIAPVIQRAASQGRDASALIPGTRSSFRAARRLPSPRSQPPP